MSVSFSGVTDITIPQGSVTKITDSSGRVLWQKDKYANEDLILHYTYKTSAYSPISDGQALEFNKDGICISHILTPMSSIFPISVGRFWLDWASYSSSVHNSSTVIQYKSKIQKEEFGFEVGTISGVSGVPMNLQFNPECTSWGELLISSFNSNLAKMSNDPSYGYVKFSYKPTGISRTFCCKYRVQGTDTWLFERDGNILSKLGLS